MVVEVFHLTSKFPSLIRWGYTGLKSACERGVLHYFLGHYSAVSDNVQQPRARRCGKLDL